MIILRNFVAIFVCAMLVNCTGGCEQNSAQKDSNVGKLALMWVIGANQKARMLARSTGMPRLGPERVFGAATDKSLVKLLNDTVRSGGHLSAKLPEELKVDAVKVLKENVPDFYVDAVEAVGELMELCDSLDTDEQKASCVEKKMASSPQTIALSKKHNRAHILLYSAH